MGASLGLALGLSEGEKEGSWDNVGLEDGSEEGGIVPGSGAVNSIVISSSHKKADVSLASTRAVTTYVVSMHLDISWTSCRQRLSPGAKDISWERRSVTVPLTIRS